MSENVMNRRTVEGSGPCEIVDPSVRHRMISDAAYALYARRGNVEGHDLEDWLTAEAEVDRLLLDRYADASAADAGRGR
jgi:hypothetical protein